MGTWLGHVAPGTYFFVFSLWWLVRTIQSYYRKQGRYTNSSSRECCCKYGCCKSINMEGLAVLLTALSGVFAEIITGMLNDQKVPLANVQHLTMYTSFGIAGVIEILSYQDCKFLPKGADYMAVIASLMVELVLFAFHLHGRSMMDTHIHYLLCYTIIGCIVSACLEVYFHKSVQIALTRIYFFMLQGTWFIQIGFLLYNPLPGAVKWDEEDHDNMMIVTLIYAWHMIGCVIGTLLICGITYRCSFRQASQVDGQRTLLPLHKQNGVRNSSFTGSINEYNSLDEYEEDNLLQT